MILYNAHTHRTHTLSHSPIITRFFCCLLALIIDQCHYTISYRRCMSFKVFSSPFFWYSLCRYSWIVCLRRIPFSHRENLCILVFYTAHCSEFTAIKLAKHSRDIRPVICGIWDKFLPTLHTFNDPRRHQSFWNKSHVQSKLFSHEYKYLDSALFIN